MKIRTFGEDLFGFDEEQEEQPYFRWTPESSRLMLKLRFERQIQFQQRKRQKKELWNEIAAQMLRQGGYIVTGDGCDLKYRNMLQTYKKNRIKEERGQDLSIVWEFYDLFRQAMNANDSVGSMEDFVPSLLGETVCHLNGEGVDDANEEEDGVKVKVELHTSQSEHEQSLDPYANTTTGEQANSKRPRLSSSYSQTVSNVEQSPAMHQSSDNDGNARTASKATSPALLRPFKKDRDSICPDGMSASELQECQVFGESVGLQLMHVNEARTRALVQLKIQELLYLAKTGRLM